MNRDALRRLALALEQRIADGARILDAARRLDYPSTTHRTADTRQLPQIEVDWPRFTEWRTRCVTLLDRVAEISGIHANVGSFFDCLSADQSCIEEAIGRLRAIHADLSEGFLDRLSLKIESEIAADLIEQAKSCASAPSGHAECIAACAIAGATLERALRAICASEKPPLSAVGANGAPLTLMPLIDCLKKAGHFGESTAAELRSVAAMRNAACHGRAEDLSPEKTDRMIAAVRAFLAEHLG